MKGNGETQAIFGRILCPHPALPKIWVTNIYNEKCSCYFIVLDQR